MTATPTMPAVRLPGDSTVEHVTVDVPTPGPGQVLLRMRASSVCGSDIRAIYREHLGHGAEAYQGVVAGHEPCGDVVEVGAGVSTLEVGQADGVACRTVEMFEAFGLADRQMSADRLTEALRGLSGDVCRSNLSSEQEQRLLHALGEESSPE